MHRSSLLSILLLAAAIPAAAQSTIDPGMSKSQVIAKLGKPSSEHASGTQTFLYYRNGQERKMGMSDMVALENDKVVDAVFRASSRKYSGRSSSPAPISAEAAIKIGGSKPRSAPMKMPVKAVQTPVAKKTTPAPTKKP